jgi:hypothetical protein
MSGADMFLVAVMALVLIAASVGVWFLIFHFKMSMSGPTPPAAQSIPEEGEMIYEAVNCLGWVECPVCGQAMRHIGDRKKFARTAILACDAFNCENMHKQFVIDLPVVEMRPYDDL